MLWNWNDWPDISTPRWNGDFLCTFHVIVNDSSYFQYNVQLCRVLNMFHVRLLENSVIALEGYFSKLIAKCARLLELK